MFTVSCHITENTAHITGREMSRGEDHLEIVLSNMRFLIMILISITLTLLPRLSSWVSRGVCHANTHPVTCHAPGALHISLELRRGLRSRFILTNAK